MVPDIASARRLTMARPRPVEDSPPVGRALRRVNFWKSFFWSAWLMPGPSSRTGTKMQSVSGRVWTWTVVLGGEYFRALERRLSRICKVAAASALAQRFSEAPTQKAMDLRVAAG